MMATAGTECTWGKNTALYEIYAIKKSNESYEDLPVSTTK